MSISAWASSAGAAVRTSSEYALAGGALLPSKIPDVVDVLPLWDFRASFRTSRGVFEFDGAFAESSGVAYDAGSAEYRYDLENDAVPAFVLLGLQADYYKGPHQSQFNFSGGWNFGGGVFLPIAEPLWLRADFRYRFGPGQTLMVLLGLSYRIPGSGQ